MNRDPIFLTGLLIFPDECRITQASALEDLGPNAKLETVEIFLRQACTARYLLLSRTIHIPHTEIFSSLLLFHQVTDPLQEEESLSSPAGFSTAPGLLPILTTASCER